MGNEVTLVSGRFHPVCNAHVEALRGLRARAQRLIIAVIGAEMPRSARYPFTADEQAKTWRELGFEAIPIAEALEPADRARQLRALAPGAASVALYAFDADYGDELRDEGVFSVTLPVIGSVQAVADRIRTDWLESRGTMGVPDSMRTFLERLERDEVFPLLAEEHAYVRSYQSDWAAAPYPPVLVTVDTLIRQADKVLLIRRGGLPGRGQWALPGGFLDPHESLLDAALRELREETGLDLPRASALCRLKARRVFDQPRRSARGRTITHAFYFDLTGLDVPELSAGDDAEALKWTGIDCALKMRRHMFEDHYLILAHFLSWVPGGNCASVD